MYASTDLFTDFKFWANREEVDAALSDPQIYRLLSLAQQRVIMAIASTFPRLMMRAPELMVTTDGGVTWQINGSDADGQPVHPFGHAEVYGRLPDGYELYGSTYGGWGDVIFEGNKLRSPSSRPMQFQDGPYIRYVSLGDELSAVVNPTLQPPQARPLITYKALELWAAKGGMRDPQPFREMYTDLWAGSGVPGDHGILGLLHTQYKRQHDASREGALWWRLWAMGATYRMT